MRNQEATDPEVEEFQDELPVGTKLMSGQYTIEKFLNSGGFGITYLAKDSLDRNVVIKECFPDSFCRRSSEIVRPRSRAHQKSFKSVVELFTKEARNQSKLEHPNIASVHQVFNENDTAYMAIDFIDGKDMLGTIEDRSLVTPENVEHWLRECLSAIGFIHKNGMLHRDISPDNIIVNSKNKPILIDFGAAKDNVNDQNKALSVMRVVKDGYSPQEFYVQGSAQTPASDLYALASTFYHVITGETPKDSQNRLASIAQNGEDTYEPLFGSVEKFSPILLKSIDEALNVLPRDRIQSAEEWLDILDGKTANEGVKEAEAAPKAPKSKRNLGLWAGAAIAGALAAFMVYSFVLTPDNQEDTNVAEAGGSTDPTLLVAGEEGELENSTSTAELATSNDASSAVSNTTDQVNSGSALVSSAEWTVILPFETSASQQPEGTFARVLLVRPDLAQDAQGWLKSGTIIYSVNGNLVINDSSIKDTISQSSEVESGELAEVELRVRSEASSDIENKTMYFETGYSVKLENGLHFFSKKSTEGTWETMVTGVPDEAEIELNIGDIIVSEAQSGIAMKDSFDLQKALQTLQENDEDTAYLTVLRGDKLHAIQLGLSY